MSRARCTKLAPVSLGLQPAIWFRERKLCLLGRRSPLRVSDKGLAIAICTAAFLVDYLACSARSTSPHSEVHGRFVALFAASAVAGARGSPGGSPTAPQASPRRPSFAGGVPP